MKSLIVIAGVLIVAAVFLFLSCFDSLQADPGVIELDKAESLALMNAQSAFVMARADRDEILTAILVKYSVTLETHSVNISNGLLIPIEVKVEEVDEETAP